MQFEEFRHFVKPPKNKDEEANNSINPVQPHENAPELSLSPDEQIEYLVAEEGKRIQTELLEQMRALKPDQFERLVVKVLVAMGYGGSVQDAGKALGRSGDDGIDGLIKQDPLGVDKIYIQAKRYHENNSVGSPEIRNFSGSLQFHRALKGVFITTSSFSKSAEETAKQLGNIILVDGNQLASLMIRHKVGVEVRASHHLYRIDGEYFDEL